MSDSGKPEPENKEYEEWVEKALRASKEREEKGYQVPPKTITNADVINFLSHCLTKALDKPK
jgi:hypothetical protein